jgi:anti-sigma B factor antagonist
MSGWTSGLAAIDRLTRRGNDVHSKDFQPGTGFAVGESTVRVTQEADGIVAISLTGEFDMATAPQFSETAERVLDGNHLVIDLSEATFIDSSMLNAVVQVYKEATSRGRVTVLQLGTSSVVERVVALSGIDQLLLRAHDRADAIRTIAQADRAG